MGSVPPFVHSWQLILAFPSIVALERSFGSGPQIECGKLSAALYADQFPCATDDGKSPLGPASQFATGFHGQEYLISVRADHDAGSATIIVLAFHGMERSETAE